MIGRRVIINCARCIRFGLMVACIGNAQQSAAPPSIVVRQCSGCHSVNGDSQLSYVPRLAGVSATYLESKLNLYRRAPTQPRDEFLKFLFRHRNNDISVTASAASQMVGVAKAASEEDLKDAARWYAAQRPFVHNAQPSQPNSEGERLFNEGVPAKNIIACKSCHGPEGKGTAGAPRLAGQHATYVLAQLALYRANGERSSPMGQIARSLSRMQSEAIAKYLEGE
jgi:cytochrome c553